MVLMALAAVRENHEIIMNSSNTDKDISGFNIKEATFISPIVIVSRVELQTYLRPIRKGHEKRSSWCEVQIFTYTPPEAMEKADGQRTLKQKFKHNTHAY